MIFNVLILILIGVIAYFHYMQGFFSALISAVIAILAAGVAVSYHEPLVTGLLKGKMADTANAATLVAIFGLTYIILRTIFDAAVPGNVRVPAIVDKVGGGVMGLVAGIFGAGILAIAAQSMPFGAAVAGYSRWPLAKSREVTVPMEKKDRQQDATVEDELVGKTLDPESATGMWIPADDIVMNLVARLSDGGSLAGEQPLTKVHPDYLGELFGQRLGVQVGASHTALNLETGAPQVMLGKPAAARLTTLNQIDSEIPNVRGGTPVKVEPNVGNEMLLVLQILFSRDAADKDGFVRVSPGGVRLVVKGKNYFPVGTLEDAKMVFVNKPDDVLFINTKDADLGADFVFKVPESEVLSGAGPDAKVSPGVFVEVKRLARLDLSGEKVGPVKPSKQVVVMRKPTVAKPKAAEPGAADAPPVATDSPFVYTSAEISGKLFSPLNAGTSDAEANNIAVDWGQASLKDGKFIKLQVNTTRSVKQMATGANPVAELYEPPGKKIIQIIGTPPTAEGADAWAWADNLREFAIVDASGTQYKPSGAVAKVLQKQAEKMVAAYDAAATADVSREEGRPTDVWLIFVVPSGTHIKQLAYKGGQVAAMEQVAQ